MKGPISISKENGKIICIMPREAHWQAVTFLPIWILGVAGMLVLTIYGQVTDGRWYGDLIFADVVMILALIWSVRFMLWNIRGREVVTMDAQMMIIEKVGIYWTIPRKYETNLIGKFEVGLKPEVTLRTFFRTTEARVLFTYWEITKSFGQSLTNKEAKEIVDAFNSEIQRLV